MEARLARLELFAIGVHGRERSLAELGFEQQQRFFRCRDGFAMAFEDELGRAERVLVWRDKGFEETRRDGFELSTEAAAVAALELEFEEVVADHFEREAAVEVADGERHRAWVGRHAVAQHVAQCVGEHAVAFDERLQAGRAILDVALVRGVGLGQRVVVAGFLQGEQCARGVGLGQQPGGRKAERDGGQQREKQQYAPAPGNL